MSDIEHSLAHYWKLALGNSSRSRAKSIQGPGQILGAILSDSLEESREVLGRCWPIPGTMVGRLPLEVVQSPCGILSKFWGALWGGCRENSVGKSSRVFRRWGKFLATGLGDCLEESLGNRAKSLGDLGQALLVVFGDCCEKWWTSGGGSWGFPRPLSWELAQRSSSLLMAFLDLPEGTPGNSRKGI